MKIGDFLDFNDPAAFDGDLDAGERCFGWPGCWGGALEWIELRAMARADQLLLSLVISDSASLMSANHRICEDASLSAKDDCRDALAGGGK